MKRIALAMVVAAVLTPEPGDAAVMCKVSAGDGRGWVWRTIDGRRCWYKGPRNFSKKMLAWPHASIAKAREETVPTPRQREPVMSEDDLRLLLSYWPPLGAFEMRWSEIIEQLRGDGK